MVKKRAASPSKIAMIFSYLHSASGNAGTFLAVANELQKQGCEVDVFTYYFDPKACFPELTKNLNIKYVKQLQTAEQNLSVTTLMSRVQAALDYYWRVKRIAPLMMDKKYDLVFTAEATAYVPALLYKQKHNVPIVWSVFDPITLVDSDKPGSLVSRYPWFKKILELHTKFDTRNLQKLEAIIVPTQKMKQQLDSFYGVSTTVLPTAGVAIHEPKNYQPLAHTRLKKIGVELQKDFVVFSHAHFQPHRRYEDLLVAVTLLRKKIPNLKLIISGSDKYDYSYFSTITNLVKKLDLENNVVIDTGYKSTEELRGYFQLADVFAFVCVEQTWGLAPFEAMAEQTPVIISDGVGAAEVLENRKNALIVKARQTKEIAQAIQELYASERLKKTLTRNAHYLLLKDFTNPQVAKKLLALFKTL